VPSCIWPPFESVGSSQCREPAAGDAVVLERAPHQAGRDDRAAVVAEAGGALLGELGHLGQLRALLAACDRGEEADRDRRLRLRVLDQRAEHRGRVDDRVGVRHRQDRAVAAGRGGRGAGDDRLLVLAARDSQVHVRVDEGRREHEALALDHAVAVRIHVGRELGDHALVHADVADAVDALGRVDDARAAHDQVVLAPVAGEEHQATSSGSAASTGTGPVVSRS
jgi:hypothetical protein